MRSASKQIAVLEKTLDAQERALYNSFLVGVMAGVRLPHKEKAVMRQDIQRLLFHYQSQGLDMITAVQRIGDPFGSFYSEACPAQWYPLDSAAKVYPLSMTQDNMAVFRISACLKNPVEPVVLQVALLSTIKRFPVFATTVRKGLFWHYLDATRKRFALREETALPCKPLWISGKRSVAFRVLYHGNRVSLEAFHILTDGTGALMFLKALLGEYLRLRGKELQADDILRANQLPCEAEFQDDFSLADPADKAEGFAQPLAAQIGGKRSAKQPAQVLHVVMPAGDLRAVAKKHHTTVTGLMVSALFVAAAASLDRPAPSSSLQIQVPANMRSHYPSKTLRNFSMYAMLRLRLEQIGDIEQVIPLVTEQLREGTSKKSLDRMMSMTNRLVQNPLIRFTPLGLKRLAFRVGYGIVGDRMQTTVLSNLGVVHTDFEGEVDRMDVVLGCAKVNGTTCGLITYNDRAVLTLTKSTDDVRFEAALLAVLSQAGLAAEVEYAKAPARQHKTSVSHVRKAATAFLAAGCGISVLVNALVGGLPWSLYVLLASYMLYAIFLSRELVEASVLQMLASVVNLACLFLSLVSAVAGGSRALTQIAMPITYAGMLVVQGLIFFVGFKQQQKNLMPFLNALGTAVGVVIFSLLGVPGVAWAQITLAAVALVLVALACFGFGGFILPELQKRIRA